MISWIEAINYDGYLWVKRNWAFWISLLMIFSGGFLIGFTIK